jgi:hypothetical protein
VFNKYFLLRILIKSVKDMEEEEEIQRTLSKLKETNQQLESNQRWTNLEPQLSYKIVPNAMLSLKNFICDPSKTTKEVITALNKPSSSNS